MAALQIQHGENGAVFADEAGKAKMGEVFGRGDFSLSLLALFTRLWAKLKGLLVQKNNKFKI